MCPHSQQTSVRHAKLARCIHAYQKEHHQRLMTQGIYFHSNLTSKSGMTFGDPMDLYLTNRLAYFMNAALHIVKHDFPYWNRTDGADHFWLPTADWGRCLGAPADYVDTGDMFSMSTFGEKDHQFITPLPSVLPDPEPPWGRIRNDSRGIIGGSWYITAMGTRDIACLTASCLAGPYRCYKHDKDIVIPSFYLKEAKPVSPFDTVRAISLLIRFSGSLQFHDHIRQRLLNYWQVCLASGIRPVSMCCALNFRGQQWSYSCPLGAPAEDVSAQLFPLPNYSLAVSTLNDTLTEMTQSIFCVCPPGQAQWTTRYFR